MAEPARVLVIGAGGLGCASGLALARAGLELVITFVDPDRVEESNLHRQVLYDRADIGRPKAVRAAERVQQDARSRGTALGTRALEDRFAPGNAAALVRDHDLVIEGTDRHESKFLAAVACVLGGVPVVHAGIVRWSGWAMATLPHRSACLRCVFEDVPADASIETCSESGVVGPAVGTIGALEAMLAARLLAGEHDVAGMLLRYDALAGTARSTRARRREGCALCGTSRTIRDLREERYAAPACAT
ncbi:MAG: HesA/MoeB/ThiF family protein [Myxococcota bacterium]|nr:HesA/MoeB/ThiF family protein [Myxococcota bacterium]